MIINPNTKAFQKLSGEQQMEKLHDHTEVTVDTIQSALVRFHKELSVMDKRSIMENSTLILWFENTPKGIDRGTLRGWFKKVSPIRILTKGNGQFDRIKVVNNAQWDFELAASLHWGDADPEATRKASAGKLEQAVRQMAVQVARTNYGNGTPLPTLLEKARELMAARLADEVAEVLKSESFETWAAKWDAQKEAAE